jgi:glycosyltransferase involved in cell wall biosynthesis
MNRRLLIVIPYFPPDPKAGGTEMFGLALSRGLAMDHGWDVTIVTTMPGKSVDLEVVPNCIAVYRLPYRFRLSNSPISATWLGELRKIVAAADPDVISINIPVPGLGDIASRAAGDRPIVVYYHFGSMRKGNLLLDPLIWLYESCLLPLCLGKAKYIACGSNYVKDGILRRFRDKTYVIPPGVDTERFRPAAHRVVAPRVLYVGSLNRSDKHKRFPDLLEACRILIDDIPELRLVAVGGGDGRQMYEHMAMEMGIGTAVEFQGRLEGDALADAYRQSAVLAVPSLRETFGMVITEAMASGLPVVAVKGGGVPEVVDDGKDGLLVPPRDPRAIASALKTVLNDPDWATSLGKFGREKVVNNLEWPHQISSMNRLFTAAVNTRHGG